MPLPANWSDGSQFFAANQNAVEAQVNTNTTDIAANSAAIVALGGSPPLPPVVPNISRVVDFGFGQSEIGHETWYTTAEIRSILAGIKAAGATRVRFAAWWAAFEPTTRNVFDWDGLDRCLNLCEEYGLIPLAVPVSPAPSYTSPTVGDFANAVGHLAARYGAQGTGQLKYYEIWNEMNHRSFYAPFESSFGPTHYTTLLIAASNAIRAADSEAFIITGGLMSTIDFAPNDILPSTFLQGIYTQGGKNYFDAVGFHWYVNEPDFTGWVQPAPDETFYVDLLACHDIMVAQGDASKLIWITEIGLPEPDVAAVTRGEWMAMQVEMLRALDFVENFWVYNFRCTDNTLTGSAQLGAVTFDFVERQPYFDYVASINRWVKGPLEGSVTTDHLADHSVTVDKIVGTGTRSATTFWNGVGQFVTPAGSGGGSGADWNTNLTNIPATFPPSTHTHDYTSGITSKPSTFPPSTHTHTNLDTSWFTNAALATTGETSDSDTALASTAWVHDTIAAEAPGGGGGSTPSGYMVAVGAVTADSPVTITHNLGTRNVNVVVRRTHLVTGGLTDTVAGEVVGVKWRVTGLNTITLDPSENWAANEFFCIVDLMHVAGDVTAPTAPTLSTTAQSFNTVDLSVTGATDAVGVVGYNWYRPAGVTRVGTTAGTTFQDTGLTAGTPYTYNAKAFDLMGTESPASNTVPTSTTVGAVLDVAGAGSRVTATTTITASQVVNTNANKFMIAWVVISQNLWASVVSDFNTLTLTSSLGTAGSPAAMTKRQTLLFGPSGQEQGSIHLYELDNPANGTHTLTLTGIPGFIGAPDSIMIFSSNYHNVASLTNIATFSSGTSVTALNQNVTSAVNNLAVCCHSNEFAISGFNKTTRDSDGGTGGTGYGKFAVSGEAVGATTVPFTTSSTGRHGFIGANLVKA